jgi:hypothetical protein
MGRDVHRGFDVGNYLYRHPKKSSPLQGEVRRGIGKLTPKPPLFPLLVKEGIFKSSHPSLKRYIAKNRGWFSSGFCTIL